MPDRLPSLAWMQRTLLFVTLLPFLAHCGPARNEFAPPCPGRAILGNAADLNVYRAGGNDLTDLVLHGRIVGMQGSCQKGDKKDQLAVTVRVGVEVTRGPAMQGREADVPVFVAVTEGNTILDKRTEFIHVVFPSNVDRVTLTPGNMNLLLPVTPSKSGAAYTILAGFQLTPSQMGWTPRDAHPERQARSRSIAASMARFISFGWASTARRMDFIRLRSS